MESNQSQTATGTSRSPEKQIETQKITTFLWFDQNAEEAVNFYTSVFKNSKIRDVARYGESGPGPKGSVMIIDFELDGQQFIALNAGPQFKFTEAISLLVHCQTQEEVDYYWTKLTADGGQEVECGWLKDKFGLSWQIVPDVFLELLRNSDEQKRDRVMKAMMKMKKLNVKELQEAVNE
jgi:predicted 3-demethylubiquinone-9 3-methyltransferase (glyoxalase superfamily)